MTSVKEPPTYEILTDETGKPRIPWLLFFDSTWRGDTGTTWIPSFTNLTITGTPTITGKTYRLSQSLVYFSVTITPATDTSAVAGSTYINNFPFTLKANGACLAVSGLLGSNAGMCDQLTNRVYVPVWTAVTVPLTVVGIVEAN
jgi:hypothetical protein